MSTGRDKKIILLTPSMSKGGAEKQLLKIALHLKTKGYTVKIVSLKPIDEFNGAIAKSGLPVLFLKSWKGNPIANLRELYREFSEFKPAVVIAFMFIAIIFARILKYHFGYKLISSIRISVLPAKWYLPFNVTSGDDVIVYNSAGSKQQFEQRYPRLKTGTVIHNEISIPARPLATAAKSGIFTWVCIGHFRWNKDYHTLFKAIARISNENFRLLVIGELNGAAWPELMLQELGLTGKVQLLGFVQEPEIHLAAADAFVLSSFSEGMPNATLEAMALAKPVVVTDIDGNRELVVASGAGLLNRQQDDQDLASCMTKIMAISAKERVLMGEKGRAYVIQNFNEEGIMRQWVNILERF